MGSHSDRDCAVSDDDGQTQMEMVGEMIDKLQQGYDVVMTEWTTKSKRSFVRKMGTKTE